MDTIVGQDISAAASLLQKGAVVAIPTETVYGLAGNALDPVAVVKIFEAKNRPSFNPLIVHAASWQQALQYVKEVPAKAILLAEKYMPGPLTLLLPKQPVIPDLVTAGSDKVAIRVPGHPLAQALLQQLDFPLAAPSANPFGYVSPTTAAHVYQGLQGKIPYILDGGAATVGLESTIVGFDAEGQVLLYRNGGISKEMLEALLQEEVHYAQLASQENPATAGQLKSHYAPHTPLYQGDIPALLNKFPPQQTAVISFQQHYPLAGENYVLSAAADLAEAARNLFTVLRKADLAGYEVILAEVFPDEGLGRAINDRLKRAQAENKEGGKV